METVSGEVLKGPGPHVKLDDRRFIDCVYDHCDLDYGGGELPEFENCVFRDCRIFSTYGPKQREFMERIRAYEQYT